MVVPVRPRRSARSAYSESGAMYAPGKIFRAGGGDPAMAETQ